MIDTSNTTVPDRVALALGLIEGKTWPEDAGEPGPHYWRVRHGDMETIHLAWCSRARQSRRRLPWFFADGKAPVRLLAWMRERPAYFRPCRHCWASILFFTAPLRAHGISESTFADVLDAMDADDE